VSTTYIKLIISQKNLQQSIDRFLHVTALCTPSILLSKPKFHFLVHLPAFIRRFGPAVLFSTERYEAYNSLFRAASVYSNRMAPSRDIARSFAALERVKHIATGGWWRDPQTKQWVCASPSVREYLLQHPPQAQLLGLPRAGKANPGELHICFDDCCAHKTTGFIVLKLEAAPSLSSSSRARVRKTHSVISWSQTLSSQLVFLQLPFAVTSFNLGASLVAQNHDVVKLRQRVIVRRERVRSQFWFLMTGAEYSHLQGPYSPLAVGEILEILVPNCDNASSHSLARILVSLFSIAPERHPILHVPRLSRTSERVLLGPEVMLLALTTHRTSIYMFDVAGHRLRCQYTA
jgi:hypothetical protein